MSAPTRADFRDEVRSFFDTVLPGVLDGVTGTIPRAKAWRAALFDQGLGAIDYPVETGGRGLSGEYRQIYQDERRGRVPREDATFGIGVGMARPTIRDHGAEALCERFLRPGLRGDEIWCQMYSEPGSGSDLAALTTRADLDGDEWIVSGQKVWTSGAQHSQFAILLARTDWDAPEHRGITMFVLPMDQDGVTVRPLVQMTGVSEFNEVFLDEAGIPKGLGGRRRQRWLGDRSRTARPRATTDRHRIDGRGRDVAFEGRSLADSRRPADRAGRTRGSCHRPDRASGPRSSVLGRTHRELAGRPRIAAVDRQTLAHGAGSGGGSSGRDAGVPGVAGLGAGSRRGTQSRRRVLRVSHPELPGDEPRWRYRRDPAQHPRRTSARSAR